ncbi:DUF3089 domain-containing protein [Sphingomonas sp.]|uniref:DUF3089 domain-containing protein n=1 Tax=Sphingomonas sp. TaxID=28214 RepID=UPI002C066E9F|nr:DUF3089 domain-containing protein [Sphingomonas sp.]HWK36599.1 DUF3089 domain-containing protein [Sphingomonas sp.]
MAVLYAATPGNAAPAPLSDTPDYADPAAWLCRPDQPTDVCARSNQDAVVLRADGSTSVERFRADPRAPVDCFYVYPTVSRDPGGNALMEIGEEEVAVVNQQFARFGTVCRRFAPLYRQVTLAALHANMRGAPIPVDRQMAYDDVKRAWDYYLARENHGRAVVLIGHSQGSGVLAQLVKNEIDGKPIQRRILSVILAGYRLQVPVGKDVGGDFKAIPLCRADGQIGCAINFASFRADVPPPPDAQTFAASAGPGLEAACVNPAALAGGDAPLRAYLGAGAEMVTASGEKQGPWTTPPVPIDQPFVEVPGLLSAACRNDGRHNYLAVTIHPDPAGKRTNDIVGDLVIDGRRLPDWGLHRIDVNLVMGNLVDVVRAQAKTYLAERR